MYKEIQIAMELKKLIEKLIENNDEIAMELKIKLPYLLD